IRWIDPNNRQTLTASPEIAGNSLAMVLHRRTRFARALIVRFEFQRGMMDVESIDQPLLQFLLDCSPLIQLRRLDHDMSLERAVMLVQLPQMQVMDLCNPRHRLQLSHELSRFDIAR